VFTAFGVNQDERENYLIDVIDPNNIQHEETALKELPTVKQYFSSQTAQTKRPKLSKEQQKRVADLLSKRHTETDPAKKKMIQKELEQYQGKEEDAGLQLKRIPLDIKQKIMTSESMTFRDFFKQD
jgi:hypothetical protein